MMARAGIRQADMARVIQIDEKTLVKHYGHELDTATAHANTQVASTLYEKAIGGDTTACIFWLKTRAGWREAKDVNVQVKQTELGDDELIERAAAIVGGTGLAKTAAS